MAELIVSMLRIFTPVMFFTLNAFSLALVGCNTVIPLLATLKMSPPVALLTIRNFLSDKVLLLYIVVYIAVVTLPPVVATSISPSLSRSSAKRPYALLTAG